MKTILFQGDSITDCKRTNTQDPKTDLGKGYPFFVSSELGFLNPLEFSFINRGISGNRITDVYARIKDDFINLKPDVLSILIGVNDVWHEINYQNGVSEDKFRKIYKMLIDELLEELPDVKIMILEPFITKGVSTDEHWDEFYCEVRKRANVAKEIAKEYNFVFIELQEKFDELCKKTNDCSYWTTDGVHPTSIGHQMIANEWKKAFNALK